MIDRTLFTSGVVSDVPVPLSDNCTVPTEAMAKLLADALECDGKRVLEIGTGSGYQAAILAERCAEVVSIEVSPPSRELLDLLPSNVTTITADGGVFSTGEEFDGVLVTFAADRVREIWAKQVREGGRLVVPIEVGSVCAICRYEKRARQLGLVDIVGYAPFTAMEETDAKDK